MINSKGFPSDVTEATADFTKAQHIDNKDYTKAKTALLKAESSQLSRTYLNYCLAAIGQKNTGALTIREACYEIGNCREDEVAKDPNLSPILVSAGQLQRHPMNFKENHDKGWDNLVKMVSGLRRKIR